jgi:hypothetical protein
MRFMCVVLSAVAAMYFGACTTPVARGEARPVASNRVLLDEYQSKTNGNSAIVLTRDNETIPSRCGMYIMIDQKSVVVLEPGEVFVAYVNAATHKLRAKMPSECAGRADNIDITTHPGKALDVRVSYSVVADVFQTIGETDLGN